MSPCPPIRRLVWPHLRPRHKRKFVWLGKHVELSVHLCQRSCLFLSEVGRTVRERVRTFLRDGEQSFRNVCECVSVCVCACWSHIANIRSLSKPIDGSLASSSGLSVIRAPGSAACQAQLFLQDTAFQDAVLKSDPTFMHIKWVLFKTLISW